MEAFYFDYIEKKFILRRKIIEFINFKIFNIWKRWSQGCKNWQ